MGDRVPHLKYLVPKRQVADGYHLSLVLLDLRAEIRARVYVLAPCKACQWEWTRDLRLRRCRRRCRFPLLIDNDNDVAL